MTEAFDPYYTWLGIPPAEQPADYYRLLGIKRFESNEQVIAEAAERQIRHIEPFKTGANAKEADKLLRKLATAKACLSDAEKKHVYDRAMRGVVAAENSKMLASDVPQTRSRKAPTSRSRTRVRNPLVELAKIVLGGIAGLVIGNAILWYGFGMDVLNVMDSREERVAKPLPHNEANVQPKSPLQDKNRLDQAIETKLPEPDSRPHQVAEPKVNPSDESVSSFPEVKASAESDEPSTVQSTEKSLIADGAPVRAGVPPVNALATAEATVRDVFADEYASAKTPAEKKDLAAKLLQVGLDTTDDMASRYVTIRSARNIAVEVGSVDLAFRATGALTSSFEIDDLAEQARLAAELAKKSRTDEESTKLIRRIDQLRQRAFDHDDHSAAASLNELSRGLGKATDKQWQEAADRWAKRIEAGSAAFGLVQAALKTLESLPEEEDANLTVGRYRCLLKGEWQIGLPYLAKGGDATLREIAERELASSDPTPNEALATADSWWDLAAEIGEIEKQQVLRRAAQLYQRASPDLSGLSAARAEKRIRELKALGIDLRAIALESSRRVMINDSDATPASPVWVTLRPTTLEASHGTKLTTLFDSSVLASGVSAETNTYVLTATSPLTKISGFQIEAIPDSSLPENGPGRSSGQFVLTEFKVFVIGSDGVAIPVSLRNASASFEQTPYTSGGKENPYKKWNAASAIDGDVKGSAWGWAISPHVGKPHRMVVETVEPIRGSGTKLKIILDHQNKTGATLGRFRLAVTSSPPPFHAFGDGRFVAPNDYFMGRNVTSVATVDLNGDSFLDLITSNTDDDSVSVRLGKGDGTFADRSDFPADEGAYGLATGDVNNDGDVDLAVASLTSNISILPGNGDGTFGSPMDYDYGSAEHRGVALNDLNNDSFLDLIYTNNATVSVRLGNDEGTFGEPTNYAVGDSPYWMTVADVNEDKAFDVITANHGSRSVSVLMNNGNGDLRHRTDIPIGSNVRCIELGDVNGDGYFDLVTANHAGNNVSVLLGDGAGIFKNRVDYAVGALATSVSLVDLNNDGNLDIAVSNFSDRSISVLNGQGDGTFANRADYFITSSPHHVICSDLDGDGDIDIVTANSDGNTVSVWLNGLITADAGNDSGDAPAK